MKTQMMKKVSVLAIALLMIAGTNLYAQRGRNYSGQDKGLNRNQSCQMIPDLTEDQQTQINTLRVANMKQMNVFRNQMNELRAKKQTLMTSDNANMKEMNSVIDQITAVKNQKMKASAKHRLDVRNLLTDEQKVYFDSRPMRGQGHGKGMGNGDGYGRRDGSGRGMNPNYPNPRVND